MAQFPRMSCVRRHFDVPHVNDLAAEFCGKRVLEKVDLEVTRINGLTCSPSPRPIWCVALDRRTALRYAVPRSPNKRRCREVYFCITSDDGCWISKGRKHIWL